MLSVLTMSASAFFTSGTAYAAQLTTRSVQLGQTTGVTTGGSAPGAYANHKFSFTVTTTAGINSIGVQYCDTATGTCTTSGNASGVDISTGANATTLDASRTNLGSSPTYTSTATNAGYVAFTAPLGGVGVVFQLDHVKNPTAANKTFYVRITTYTSANASTGSTDSGVVAASTAQTITLTGIMPEYIQFCTGDATLTANCGTVGSGAISFNQEFSPSDTATAVSKMSASTNAGSGYAITVTGTTLTSGTNTIPTVGGTATSVAGARGTSKFGLNLVANTTAASTVAIGAAVSPASNGTNYQANPTANFATADSFALDLATPAIIAKSDQGTPGTSKPTDSQVYTVSYFVDVSGSQAPGTYVSTLNYVCTATF